jgi:putative serine protease PepD
MSQWNRSSDQQFLTAAVYRAPLSDSTSNRPARAGKIFRPLAIALVALSAAVIGGIVASSAFTLSYLTLSQPAPIVVNQSDKVNWVTGAAAQAAPSVVTLSVVSSLSSGSGSGVILTENGYILTNAHVVTLSGLTEDAVITARLSTGEVYRAKLVGFDPVYDLAVIKISASGLKPIQYANSDELNVGQSVVAIGAPLGLSSTVTQGIVSALNRTIQVASAEVNGESGLQFWSGNGVPPISLQVIQTDAAINPGNSGGALVDSQGNLIGINVAIATAGAGEAGSIGVGFAIPSNTVKRIADEIVNTGSATHGLLGALVRDNTQEDSAFSTGARIEDLTSGGAAEKAGLKRGDVVVAFGGKRVNSASDLTALVRAQPAGAEVVVDVLRSGTVISFNVKLGDAADLK